MKLGMVGLGRMGSSMVRRLLGAGHECVVFDLHAEATQKLAGKGAIGAATLVELAGKLDRPRTIWIMVPAAAVDATLADLVPRLASDAGIVDGGNSD